MKLKIGVMGGASGLHSEENLAKAKALGRTIAEKGAILFYGATIGLPLAAAEAAREAKGTVVGVSPASNEKEHLEKFRYPLDACDIVVYTGMGLAGGRNTVLVKSCDAIIVIGGGIGTMNEFSIAYAAGIPIGVLEGTGRFADQVRRLEKEALKNLYGTQLVFESNPARLVKQLVAAVKARKD